MMIEEETIEQLIRKCYDIVGVPQPTDEEVEQVEYDCRKAVNGLKLQMLLIRISTRQMIAKCPKKLRRAWKNYKRKRKKYLDSL